MISYITNWWTETWINETIGKNKIIGAGLNKQKQIMKIVMNKRKVVEKSLRTKLFFFFLFKEKNYESSND
jgi:hypothetical protein